MFFVTIKINAKSHVRTRSEGRNDGTRRKPLSPNINFSPVSTVGADPKTSTSLKAGNQGDIELRRISGGRLNFISPCFSVALIL